MELPSPDNQFQSSHAVLMMESYLRLTGRPLIEPDTGDPARALFEAPFFLASHNTALDPVLTYGNQTALDLFETDWHRFTSTPSRFTAETPEQEERERLLEAVRSQGFIDDYSGIRISSTGKRFVIERATVWNLVDSQGKKLGQAATFDSWRPL